mgnify:CR=1 FL=1
MPAVLAAKPGESFGIGGTHVQSTTATATTEAVLPAAEELRPAMPLSGRQARCSAIAAR